MKRILLVLAIVLCWVGAAGAEVVVRGEKKLTRNDLSISGTDRPDDFRTEIYGDEISITTDALPAGKLTIELDLAETYHHAAGKRAMSIFSGDTMLAPRVDIFEEAGAFAKPITRAFTIDHKGGPVVIRLVTLEDKAKFNVLRIRNSAGQVVVTVTARDARLMADTGTPREPFRLLKAEELVFFNADHSPFGAYDSLVYGCRGEDRRWGGFAHATGGVPSTGVMIGMIDESGLHRLPFMPGASGEISPASIRRTLRPCSDTWTTPSFSFTHYSPAWSLPDLDHASIEDKQRFLLPATWIEFSLKNASASAPAVFVFGLPARGTRRTFAGGAFEGYAFDDLHYLAIARGTGELFTPDEHSPEPARHGALLAVRLAPGETRSLRVIVASYDPQSSTGPVKGKFYYTSLFASIDDVIARADALFPQAKQRCETLDNRLAQSGLNAFRQFLAAYAMHSYLYNTLLLADDSHQPVFAELEGQYAFINTFDLTIDHAFYQLAMHPWTLRNILDKYATHYTYRNDVYDLAGERHEGGRSFTHDMGRSLNFSPVGTSAYEIGFPLMTAEELQNWILCAGLYWKKTGDRNWLLSHEQTLREAMDSMLNRDAASQQDRLGIIGLVSVKADHAQEITTYDALDHSLKSVRASGYLAVKCWAAYVAMEAMFNELHDRDRADLARAQAQRAARTVVAHQDPKTHTIPAVFDGKSKSLVIPMIEALAYPQQMGLDDAVSTSGPYGPMIRALHDHLDAILKPGQCLDSASGAWKLSSTSNNTWQSKVYLSQYVAEQILKIQDDRTGGRIDAIHASFQVLGTPEQAWNDQLDSTNGRAMGSMHYPRGITSALWWLVEKKER